MLKEKKNKQTKITYEDIKDIVEYLVGTKSYQYRFDCYEADDIGQEIRLICIRALEHFDVDRVEKEKWKNFFGRCVDNALKNLKRDNYIRTASPCTSDCSLLHGDEYLNNFLGHVCKRWLKFRKGLQRKISIMHPLNIEKVGHNIQDRDFEKEIETEDLINYLRKILPHELRESFNIMVGGRANSVSLRDKKKIRKILKGVLE
jgi:hypothetical protein